jgi:hypothetical protein
MSSLTLYIFSIVMLTTIFKWYICSLSSAVTFDLAITHKTVMCMGHNYRRVFGLEIGFIYYLQGETTNSLTLPLISTIYKSLQHVLSLFKSAFTSHFSVTDLHNENSSTAMNKSSLHRLPYKWLPSLHLTTF